MGCTGTWSLPGGHLEFGETFEQCAIREIAEETGLEIEDVRFLTATESMMKWQDREWHYVTIFMTAFAKGSTELKVCYSLSLRLYPVLGWIQ